MWGAQDVRTWHKSISSNLNNGDSNQCVSSDIDANIAVIMVNGMISYVMSPATKHHRNWPELQRSSINVCEKFGAIEGNVFFCGDGCERA